MYLEQLYKMVGENLSKTEIEPEILKFVTELASVNTSGLVFNPYNQTCEINDSNDSASIRAQNLSVFLSALLRRQADSLWIGESVGYNGSRRSGLYLYGEESFNDLAQMLNVDTFKVATLKPLPNARTVNAIWDSVKSISNIPVTFNIFPFHSYLQGNQLSNRKPQKSEIVQYLYLTRALLEIFQFSKVIAVGRLPEYYLQILGVEHTYVRHPSMGGAKTFHQQISDIYTES